MKGANGKGVERIGGIAVPPAPLQAQAVASGNMDVDAGGRGQKRAEPEVHGAGSSASAASANGAATIADPKDFDATPANQQMSLLYQTIHAMHGNFGDTSSNVRKLQTTVNEIQQEQRSHTTRIEALETKLKNGYSPGSGASGVSTGLTDSGADLDVFECDLIKPLNKRRVMVVGGFPPYTSQSDIINVVKSLFGANYTETVKEEMIPPLSSRALLAWPNSAMMWKKIKETKDTAVTFEGQAIWTNVNRSQEERELNKAITASISNIAASLAVEKSDFIAIYSRRRFVYKKKVLVEVNEAKEVVWTAHPEIEPTPQQKEAVEITLKNIIEAMDGLKSSLG